MAGIVHSFKSNYMSLSSDKFIEKSWNWLEYDWKEHFYTKYQKMKKSKGRWLFHW